MHFVENHIGKNVDTLNLFSDACTGQNRNTTMVHFLLALANSGRFKKIYHNFPVRGHSFLPCDSDFSHLGRIKRKQEHVGLPQNWIEIFSEKYHVIPFQDIKFFDFVSHFKIIFKKTVIVKGNKFLVTKYKRFSYTHGHSTVAVSEHLGTDIWQTFNLLRPGINAGQLTMPQGVIYEAPSTVCLKTAKLNDIKKLFKYLSPDDIAYYSNLKDGYTDSGSDTDAAED